MKQDLLLAFGQRVKQIRLAKGFSQEALGELAELDRTYVSGIERGKRNVALLNIARLAEALDVPMAHLVSFGEDDD
ncbi:MAG: transcriptional regulator [Oleibacter sp.]|nr:transcriptional regulator [Thalassolituus sp.]|tara:strand:+ start:537 stop:764 length:228 start_codon:yes stop_codon:yes gene_type:complete